MLLLCSFLPDTYQVWQGVLQAEPKPTWKPAQGALPRMPSGSLGGAPGPSHEWPGPTPGPPRSARWDCTWFPGAWPALHPAQLLGLPSASTPVCPSGADANPHCLPTLTWRDSRLSQARRAPWASQISSRSQPASAPATPHSC